MNTPTTTTTLPAGTDPAPTDTTDTAEVGAGLAPGWRLLSAALTDEAALIADRDDLLVTIAPGAGHGAPACLIPNEAMIEIDGTHLGGLDPATLRPEDPADRARYDTAWGLLVHECAHARHSLWTTPHTDGSADDGAVAVAAGAVAAAELLEESKIEAAQIRVRPDDRHWLRASARALILDNHAPTGVDGFGAAALGRAEAANAAALLLARTDGGILTPDETEPVRAAVEATLGADTLAQLRSLWQAAHTTAPDDGAAMVELGRRWCQALGEDPTTPPPAPATGCTTTGTEPTATPDPGATGADPDAGAGRSPLQQAIDDTLRAVAAHVAAETPPPDPAAARAARERADETARTRSERMARRVFNSDADPTTGHTAIAGTRPPTQAERASARQIGRALSTAGIRERAVVRAGSVLPPGRLRMRGARAADAQRAAGVLFPTAEPFVRTTRTPTPTPPLRVGIACDVSGSMREFADPVASAAWILAHAAGHAHLAATSAAVIFGARVRPITHPGTPPPAVTLFEANDGVEQIAEAIDALDGALDLAGGGAARLLVIVSDGCFRPLRRTAGQARVDRLRAAGCGVLWLVPAVPYADPLKRCTVVELADPATTAQAIAHAATTALRAATR